jgi:hypothetical protein
MGWRGFGLVHHSRPFFCRAVPNPNLTIRHLFIAVGELLAQSAAEALRRLPVVMVEDALLHPALPLVVWLMAGSAKGLTLAHHPHACSLQVAALARSPSSLAKLVAPFTQLTLTPRCRWWCGPTARADETHPSRSW